MSALLVPPLFKRRARFESLRSHTRRLKSGGTRGALVLVALVSAAVLSFPRRRESLDNFGAQFILEIPACAGMTVRAVMTMLAMAALFSSAAHAQSLSVFPPAIQLDNGRDTQRVIVVLTREDGVTVDVTAQSQVAIEPAGIAAWREDFKMIPQTDGEGTVTVTYEAMSAQVPVRAANIATDPHMSFRNDIQPVLMRAGCNAGACHGAASGKNGFALSLFGYDPGKDYLNLTRDARGRRMDASTPEESLMLLKPTGAVDHEGGERIEKGDPLYEMLRRWIAEGAANDPGEVAGLTGITVMPPTAVLEGVDTTHRFTVQATYTDGTVRDVTDLAILASGDDQTLTVDPAGLATVRGRGEVYLMARFGTFAEISQIICIPQGEQVEWPAVEPKNYVDEMIYAKLKKLRVAPAETCSDEIFLRRVYLDIVGMLPTVDEARAFLSETAPDKRAKLIDALLERPEFSELWAMKWAEILQVKSDPNKLDPKGMYRYNDWLRHAITNNKPIDELVRELLTAEGGNFTQPAANFYLVQAQPEMMAEDVAQIFMGVQIKCAQCHNHPFERWTMEDYYSFAAFFAQVGRKASSDPRESIVYNRASGEVNNLKNGQAMAPKFLGGATPDLQGRDRRAALAEWLTSPDNAWFAKNFANRIWAHYFGKGIVDPPDDVRVSNPPKNAALLDELGRRLVEYKYDMRQLIRDICNSNTYQLATAPRNDASNDPRNFAVASVRRLPSEMLLDAVCQVTDTTVKFRALPMGARAVQVADADSGNYFLNVFGRPARNSACTCERRDEPTLAQTLHLINGDTLQNAIAAGDGRLAASIAAEMPPTDIVENLYLAAYSRFPREDERAKLATYIESAEDRKLAAEDAYWSVLNSKEFVFNH